MMIKMRLLQMRPLHRSMSTGGWKKMFDDLFNASPKIDTKAKTENKITFKDVAGLHEAKQEVKEFVDYLKDNKRFLDLGAHLPRGALLLGPPGCGKTLLVKALANEAQVPFLLRSGPEFVEMVGGRGAARVRKLFADAREKAPSIIFVDEIDSIGSKRSSSGNISGGTSEREQTLNQLLIEMDGMSSTAGIVVFAATNRHEVLDKALLRSGRFDRHIMIDLPNVQERREIFALYLSQYTVGGDLVEMGGKLASYTPGMSGADIANVVNEAALLACKIEAPAICMEHFEMALERVIAGAAKKNRILSESERRLVAFHEAGHALVGWMLKNTDRLLRVSIVPRTSQALGFAQVTPKERYMMSSDDIFDRMCVLLGGRVAEAIVFNKVSTGAQDDLRKVTDIAYRQIVEYGMNDKIGHVSFERQDPRQAPLYSKATQAIMDREVKAAIGKAFKFTEDLIREHREMLNTIAENLLKREVLTYIDMVQLIGAPPHDPVIDTPSIKIPDPNVT